MIPEVKKSFLDIASNTWNEYKNKKLEDAYYRKHPQKIIDIKEEPQIIKAHEVVPSTSEENIAQNKEIDRDDKI